MRFVVGGAQHGASGGENHRRWAGRHRWHQERKKSCELGESHSSWQPPRVHGPVMPSGHRLGRGGRIGLKENTQEAVVPASGTHGVM